MTDINIIRENEFEQTMKDVVDPELKTLRQDGTFEGYDGKPLCYHKFCPEGARGTVVIVHGFTESSEKYDEMCWYFIKSGLSVYLYDQRGHAKSWREVEDKTITHVRKFEEYVKDLECFIDRVVPKDGPFYLFSHSMGGGVAALYIEAHPDKFEKAVLSSPMIAPSTGNYPAFLGKMICGTMTLFGQSKKRLFLSGEYPGEESFEDSCGNSEVRFRRYEQFKRTHSDYQNYSPTYRWTLESLKVKKKILKKGRPEGIATKVLLLSAGKDNMVENEAQREFAARVPGCVFEEFPGSKHEIFIGTDDIMSRYVPAVLDFIHCAECAE